MNLKIHIIKIRNNFIRNMIALIYLDYTGAVYRVREGAVGRSAQEPHQEVPQRRDLQGTLCR